MLGNNLFDILITPVQRIPRYVLLLKDMIKSTPSTHPDKQYIEEAYTLVKEIADYVNSMKKLADNVVELQQLQQKFSGYPGKLDSLSTRKFIKDVVLTIDKEKVRMWLFDDIAIVTKPEAKRGDVYKYRYSFDLQTSKLALDTDTYTCKLFTSDSPSVRVIQYDGPKECADSFAEINGIIEKASECLIQGACGENQLALHSDGSQAYNESVNLKLLENRRAAFERLCASDNAYTNQLKTCVNSIIKPVQESGVIDSTTFCTIFSNFEMLCEKATAINFDLNTRLKEWNTNNNTADIFMSHEAELRFYTHYASHYNEQLSALDKAEENKDFVNYLHKCELVAGCSLRSVFELPMRKLSEYQITLQEMHINSKNHVEYEDLGAALKKLKLMNENIFLKGNESKIEKSTRRK